MRDFKLVACDNPTSAGAAFVGREARFSYDGTRFYFSSLYSSTVASIRNIDENLFVQTRNTLYTFAPVNIEPHLTDEQLVSVFV